MRDMRKKEEGEKVKLGKKWIGGKDWRSERNAGVSPAGGDWVTEPRFRCGKPCFKSKCPRNDNLLACASMRKGHFDSKQGGYSKQGGDIKQSGKRPAFPPVLAYNSAFACRAATCTDCFGGIMS